MKMRVRRDCPRGGTGLSSFILVMLLIPSLLLHIVHERHHPQGNLDPWLTQRPEPELIPLPLHRRTQDRQRRGHTLLGGQGEENRLGRALGPQNLRDDVIPQDTHDSPPSSVPSSHRSTSAISPMRSLMNRARIFCASSGVISGKCRPHQCCQSCVSIE